MRPKTIFRQEKNLVYQLRRSQLVILVLPVVLGLAMLNSAYNVVDLAAANVRPFVVITTALILLEAIFSAATFAHSYQKKQK